jgi:hypothetical protein
LGNDRQATAEKAEAVAHMLQAPPALALVTSKPGPSSDTSKPTLCASSCRQTEMRTECPPCFEAFWIASRQQY